MRILLSVLLLVAGLPVVAAAQVTRDVCASGCTYATLAAAITAAQPGDTITLQAGQTFTGNWVLPNKGASTAVITIRSSAPDSQLPAAGVRMSAAYGAQLPRLRGSTTTPVISFASGAHHWRLRFLDIGGNDRGYGSIVEVGTANSSFDTYAELPYAITIDQNYIHGDPIIGQRRGIAMNGGNGTCAIPADCGMVVRDNLITDIKSVGSDSNGISAWTGAGPYLVHNNRIEAGAEIILFGGGDPQIRIARNVLASPAPTLTTARLDSVVDLKVSDIISFAIPTSTGCSTTNTWDECRRPTHVRSINAGTGDITFDALPAMFGSPSVPPEVATGGARYGLTPSNAVITNNYLTRPLAWMNPVVDQPVQPTGAAGTGTSTLAPGVQSYRIKATLMTAEDYRAMSRMSDEVQVTTDATNDVVTLTWVGDPIATDYRIFKPNGTYVVATCANPTACTFQDTGQTFSLTESTNPYLSNYVGHLWEVKNIFELKHSRNVTFENNILENHWVAAQNGYSVLFTTRDQDGNCQWCSNENITFRYNWIRNVSGGVNLLAMDNNNPSGIADNFNISHNLWQIDQTLRGAGTTQLQGTFMFISRYAGRVTVNHNTAEHQQRILATDNGPAAGALIYTNNTHKHNQYGILGTGGSIGTGTLNVFWPTPTPGWTFAGNAIAGGTSSSYPSGNFFPSVSTWQAGFTLWGGPDLAHWSLVTGAPGKGLATDGGDIGADIPALQSRLANVVNGNQSGAAISWVTTTLPTMTVGLTMTHTLAVTGGTAPYVFSLFSGTLPPGISLAGNGVLSGTPSTSGAYPITVRVVDSSTSQLVATQPFSITVVPGAVVLTTTSLPAGTQNTQYSTTLSASGGLGQRTWSVVAGTLPTGLTLTATTGTLSGTPTALGTSSSFTIRVTDSATPTPTSDQRAFTLDVVAPTAPVRVHRFPKVIVDSTDADAITVGGGLRLGTTAPAGYVLTADAQGQGTWQPSVPIGAVLPYAGGTAPAGWLRADGACVSRTTYAALFAIVSTTYGVCDGSTTFGLPNLVQRFPLGYGGTGTGATLGSVGGALDHAHTYSAVPAHTHGGTAGGGSPKTNADAGGTYDIMSNFSRFTAAEGVSPPLSTSGTNPPFVALNYIVRVQ